MDVTDPLVLGLDIGTSGVRCVALDAAGDVAAHARRPLPPPRREATRVTQDPRLWWAAALEAIDAVAAGVDARRIAAMAVDGTSGTLLATDARGEPLADASMYDDAGDADDLTRIASVAPADSPALGATSPLARLLRLQREQPRARHLLHPADWIAGQLGGRHGFSDENNVLKLGYDLQARRWPAWFDALGVRRDALPEVRVPGAPLGGVAPELARRWGLAADAVVAAGTTDGVAAFLATGAGAAGDAVTSLGSTLVLKLMCDAPAFAPDCGLYSHRLGERWLAGGASNAGGAVLLQHFGLQDIERLVARIDPTRSSGLDYYPLPATGERFPIADPTLQPRLAPRPDDDARFLHGLLEGLVRIEALGYERLAEHGAGRPVRLFTTGGGRHNPAWMALRERQLGVPLVPARHEEAACGAAMLARSALDRGT